MIDRNRCGAKGDCVAVCPYGVFELRKLTTEERAGVGLRGRLKLFVHRGRQAVTPRIDACHACGLCVTACPEQAIKLIARTLVLAAILTMSGCVERGMSPTFEHRISVPSDCLTSPDCPDVVQGESRYIDGYERGWKYAILIFDGDLDHRTVPMDEISQGWPCEVRAYMCGYDGCEQRIHSEVRRCGRDAVKSALREMAKKQGL